MKNENIMPRSFGLGTVLAVLFGAVGAILAGLGVLEQFAVVTSAQLDGWSSIDLYVTGGILVVIAVVSYIFETL